MARLHEYQGKALLARHGVLVPRGSPASSPDEAARIARELGGRVVVKIQAWTTNRKALGGVAFAASPQEAADAARRMLALKVGNFPVAQVLVEEAIPIKDELFVSLFIDDRERAPAMLVSLAGGSGIEERARTGDGAVHRLACDVIDGPRDAEIRSIVKSSKIEPRFHDSLVATIRAVFEVARRNEARSVEINPLVTTTDGRVVAADCRITIDDYAVGGGRHPELGIDIARELDHPPTALERIAYAVEQEDHRGTFYFAQLATEPPPPPAPGSRGLIGFHGAGGGGSMMSMDAITAEDFTIADFTDTSGNPSPAKVYRAARIILAQPGLVGYFGSGSGVASQEQYWSAYGLAKAFWELNLDIPAVIRLGGNTEDRAVEILQSACKDLPAKVEGYKKADPPARIAARFAALVDEHRASPSATARESSSAAVGGSPHVWKHRTPRRPSFVGSPTAVSFPLKGGRVWIDTPAWKTHSAAILARSSGLLRDQGGRPSPTLSESECATKDSEFIACEVECRRDGVGGADGAVFVELSMPGLDEYLTSGGR